MKKSTNKKAYGECENVFLSDEEYQKLINKLTKETTEEYIEKMDLYIESIGKDKYKSHYAAILNWNRRDTENFNRSKKLQDSRLDKSRNKITRKPTYDIERIKRDALNNLKIKY